MRHPRPKFKVSFYLYFCCFWINVTQINFENINASLDSRGCRWILIVLNLYSKCCVVSLYDETIPDDAVINFYSQINSLKLPTIKLGNLDYNEVGPILFQWLMFCALYTYSLLFTLSSFNECPLSLKQNASLSLLLAGCEIHFCVLKTRSGKPITV